jgi:hypothetical protein
MHLAKQRFGQTEGTERTAPRAWRCMKPFPGLGALAVAAVMAAAALPAKADAPEAKIAVAAPQQKKADVAKDLLGDVALAVGIGFPLLGLQHGLARHNYRRLCRQGDEEDKRLL